MDLRVLNNRLQSIDKNQMLRNAIEANEKAILDINREQLRVGERADGLPITPAYSPFYNAWKSQQSSYKAGSKKPDLYLTGSFQDKMYLDIEGNNIIVDSIDPKRDRLVHELGYTDKIFGTQQKNLPRVQNLTSISYVREFKQKTGL